MVVQSVLFEVDVPMATIEGFPYFFHQTIECDIQNADGLKHQVERMKHLEFEQSHFCYNTPFMESCLRTC